MAEESTALLLDSERQTKAKEYAAVRRRLLLVDLGVGAAYVLFWLVTRLNITARDWVIGLSSNPFIVTPRWAATGCFSTELASEQTC